MVLVLLIELRSNLCDHLRSLDIVSMSKHKAFTVSSLSFIGMSLFVAYLNAFTAM